jgi:hypothetical protein
MQKALPISPGQNDERFCARFGERRDLSLFNPSHNVLNENRLSAEVGNLLDGENDGDINHLLALKQIASSNHVQFDG